MTENSDATLLIKNIYFMPDFLPVYIMTKKMYFFLKTIQIFIFFSCSSLSRSKAKKLEM